MTRPAILLAIDLALPSRSEHFAGNPLLTAIPRFFSLAFWEGEGPTRQTLTVGPFTTSGRERA